MRADPTRVDRKLTPGKHAARLDPQTLRLASCITAVMPTAPASLDGKPGSRDGHAVADAAKIRKGGRKIGNGLSVAPRTRIGRAENFAGNAFRAVRFLGGAG